MIINTMINAAMSRAVRLALLTVLLQSGVAQAATVQQFIPQGRIDQQNRAMATFSTEMVKLGDTGR